MSRAGTNQASTETYSHCWHLLGFFMFPSVIFYLSSLLHAACAELAVLHVRPAPPCQAWLPSASSFPGFTPSLPKTSPVAGRHQAGVLEHDKQRETFN